MQFVLGYESKIKCGPASAAPTAELKCATDVSVDCERSKKDVTARYTGAFKTYIAGMVDVNLTFKVFADADAASNETVSDLKQAYITGTARAFKVEFGDGSYFQADMIITKFSLSSAVDDAVTYDIEICPTIVSEDFLPTIAVASAGN